MLEIYDLGRTTHQPFIGLFEFIRDNAQQYVEEAAELEEWAVRRMDGASIPQEYFTQMCDIWLQAHDTGKYRINPQIYPDTAERFQRVRQRGDGIAVLSSSTPEFMKLCYDMPAGDGRLSDLVNHYLSGRDVGDKDHPDTYTKLWEATEGHISAIFDDKLSVCRAAKQGFPDGQVRIYLVDRRNLIRGGEDGIYQITNFHEVQE